MKKVMKFFKKEVALRFLASFVLATVSIATGLTGGSTTFAESISPEFFATPTPTQGVPSITNGPDGNLWFTMPNEDRIGKSTVGGEITEYATSPGSQPSIITAGPDGNLWFTMQQGQKFGKITTDGVVTEYNVGINIALRSIVGITAGPDGNLWVAASYLNGSSGGKILKISTAGNVTADYDLSNNSPGALNIVPGPDGNLWFTMGGSSNNSTNYIGKIDASGNATEYALPGLGSGSSAITVGPDGNLWYLRILDAPNGSVGKIDTSGNATEYALPSGAFAYYGIVTGPDDRLWFTETGLNKIASVDSTGNIVEYDLPANFGPTAITLSVDGDLWLGTVSGVARIAGDEDPETPGPVDPNSPNTETPSVPRTGRLLGAIISTSAIFGIILVIGYELKKKHHLDGASNK
jgi:virginiamycin B lyase